MMKKVFMLLLVTSTVLSLAGCGGDKEPEKKVSTLPQVGGGSGVIRDYGQGMAPPRENGDGTITFGNPSGKADIQLTD